VKRNLRILLKALRKTFTSITLVGFIQFLILGLILSVLFSVLLKVFFNISFLWSGYLFLFIYYFLNRLIIISKTIDEEKVDITVLSEEVDKEKNNKEFMNSTNSKQLFKDVQHVCCDALSRTLGPCAERKVCS
tara:strand:+ start:50 stop:448 length:399 start_codon:yes stop_codon:yes gene_type:complete